MKYCFFKISALLLAVAAGNISQADILATGFFSGTIERFNETTTDQTNFATFAGNPGLSGIAYSAFNNQVYVSALNFGGVFRLDPNSGSSLGFAQFAFGPGGLTVAGNGNVYVTDFTSNNVYMYNSTLTTLLSTITVPPTVITPGDLPVTTTTTGVGLANNGDLFISTSGSGVFKFDGTDVTQFANQGLATAQVAVDGSNNVYVGHGFGLSNDAYKFDSSGIELGPTGAPGSPFLTVTDQMVNGTGNGSSDGTSPSGLAFDSSGNLIVSVLGRSNPGNAGGERGGLFRYDVNGNLLDTFTVGSVGFSGVAIVPTAVPEPGSFAVLALVGTVGIFVLNRRRKASQVVV